MTLPYTFSPGTKAKSSEVNADFAKVDTQSPPIGAIVSWAKNLTGVPALPADWLECNGQVVSDAGSPLNGQTLPSLNTTNRFLRGNATSGSTGGAATHLHQVTAPGNGGNVSLGSGSTGSYDSGGNLQNRNIAEASLNAYTTIVSNLPPYYNIVWIIRIK